MTGFMKQVVPIVIDHANGATVTDENGRDYLDCFSGISVVNAGHCNPQVIAAAKAQMDKLVHCRFLHLSRKTSSRPSRKARPNRPARPDQNLLRQRRSRSHRRRHEAGAPVHRQARIHLAPRQLSRTQLGHPQHHRQPRPQKTRRPLRPRRSLRPRTVRLPFAMAQRPRRMRTPMRQSHRRRHPLRHFRRRGRIHRRAGHGRRRHHLSRRQTISRK